MNQISPRSGHVLLRRAVPCAWAGKLFRTSSAQRLQCFSCASAQRIADRQVREDRFKLPDSPCRTRFAPSPTGYLHLGSLRTALFNYLLARATGGQFILRIEDTDQTRLVPDAEEKLYEDLKWAGLSWDEGPDIQGPYGPYRQSERLPLYAEHANKLVREGKAYRCFCSPEALEEHKRQVHELGQPTLYPGTCRNIPLEESDRRAAAGERYAVRFKSSETPVMIHDIIYNRFRKKDPEDDYVILKRDGFPTYHFANVVDDRHMKITHVIRGAEWLISTPKHVELYSAFGWEPPKFAHLGLLVDQNRQKLSKRDNSANMAWYKESRILPVALLNFAAQLGWRGKGPQGNVMDLQEMVANFNLQFTKGDIIVSLQKLPHLQDKHLARLAPEDRKVSPAPQFQTHVLAPIKSAIAAIEESRRHSLPTIPSSIPASSLGEPLQTPRILSSPFEADLVRGLLGTRLNLDDPTARFSEAVAKLKYFIWQIPLDVLVARLKELELGSRLPVSESEPVPVKACDDKEKLVEAIGYMLEKVSAVDEGSWTREGLDKLLKDVLIGDGRMAGIYAGVVDDIQKLVFKLMRWALVASEPGLPIPHTMHVLGREQTLQRLGVAKSVVEEVVNIPEGHEDEMTEQ